MREMNSQRRQELCTLLTGEWEISCGFSQKAPSDFQEGQRVRATEDIKNGTGDALTATKGAVGTVLARTDALAADRVRVKFDGRCDGKTGNMHVFTTEVEPNDATARVANIGVVWGDACIKTLQGSYLVKRTEAENRIPCKFCASRSNPDHVVVQWGEEAGRSMATLVDHGSGWLLWKMENSETIWRRKGKQATACASDAAVRSSLRQLCAQDLFDPFDTSVNVNAPKDAQPGSPLSEETFSGEELPLGWRKVELTPATGVSKTIYIHGATGEMSWRTPSSLATPRTSSESLTPPGTPRRRLNPPATPKKRKHDCAIGCTPEKKMRTAASAQHSTPHKSLLQPASGICVTSGFTVLEVVSREHEEKAWQLHSSKAAFSNEHALLKARIFNNENGKIHCRSWLLADVDGDTSKPTFLAAITIRLNPYMHKAGLAWAQVMNLSVLEERKGYGIRLVAGVEKLLQREGVDLVSLYPVQNNRATAFWASMGYAKLADTLLPPCELDVKNGALLPEGYMENGEKVILPRWEKSLTKDCSQRMDHVEREGAWKPDVREHWPLWRSVEAELCKLGAEELAQTFKAAQKERGVIKIRERERNLWLDSRMLS